MKLSAQLFFHVSSVEKLLFTKRLAVMLKSGITLYEAVETLRDQTQNRYFKTILSNVLSGIENGQSLRKSLAKYPHVFEPLYINLVGIGEESGNLDENLDYIALQLRKAYEFRKKVQGAMMYPMIVLTLAIIMGGAISLFILPRLIDLFSSFHTELPFPTKVLLFLANTMKNYGFFIFGGIIGCIISLAFLFKIPSMKKRLHFFLLSVPAVGIVLQNIQLAYLCRNLGITLKSGIPISSAIKSAHDATDNMIYQEYIERLGRAVDRGKSIEKELSLGSYRFIPTIAAKMIGVGEKTGKLEDTFLYLSDFFEEEVDDTTKTLANTLEPMLLLFIGLVVAFIALAIISPIYEFTGSIRK